MLKTGILMESSVTEAGGFLMLQESSKSIQLDTFHVFKVWPNAFIDTS